MGVRIIKNIETLIELLSSLFKKNLSGEYYTNKSVKSIFYISHYAQEEQAKNVLNKSEEHSISTKLQLPHIQSEQIPTQSRSNQNIADLSNQPNVNIGSSVQKLELPKKGESLKINLSHGNVKPIVFCDAERPKKADIATQPKKLSDNPNFSKIKQELENKLKNSLGSNSQNTDLLSSKNKEQEREQVCKENTLSFISSSKDISILPIEPKTKQEPVISNDNNSSIPLPPPIGDLANFKGPKLPLSLPMQEQSRIKQEKFCNTSQNKIVNMQSNLNNVPFMEQLTLTLEQRKGKAHSV
ncbi:MAG: hypothetical protein sL5_02240 [Candidatus Mesenet longicola]|uniref:Uncharacterized protein n=1 Tax=Candidatus Mesenet longicola TaxID=1892558 RepID=A0A8J3HVV3_9RICK|nr:MAG: hypothetical protein sGL2_02230 [Candidatus Mesenet longicola]GHM59231.1 MAG: hypothetical protein sL5_02240 [Candidatus Mesenet longicola]